MQSHEGPKSGPMGIAGQNLSNILESQNPRGTPSRPCQCQRVETRNGLFTTRWAIVSYSYSGTGGDAVYFPTGAGPLFRGPQKQKGQRQTDLVSSHQLSLPGLSLGLSLVSALAQGGPDGHSVHPIAIIRPLCQARQTVKTKTENEQTASTEATGKTCPPGAPVISRIARRPQERAPKWMKQRVSSGSNQHGITGFIFNGCCLHWRLVQRRKQGKKEMKTLASDPKVSCCCSFFRGQFIVALD